MRLLEGEEAAAQVASLLARWIAVLLDVAARRGIKDAERRTAWLKRGKSDLRGRRGESRGKEAPRPLRRAWSVWRVAGPQGKTWATRI